MLAINPFGGFDASFTLPPTMNLGYAMVELEAAGVAEKVEGSRFAHQFQVQEFRRPEFEVTARTETEGPLFVGDYAKVSVAANYFAGGGLQNAEVKWNVSNGSPGGPVMVKVDTVTTRVSRGVLMLQASIG